MVRQKLTNEDGYTIVEVVIAMALLVTALIPTSQLVAKVFNATGYRDLMIAKNLGGSYLEKTLGEQDFFNGSLTIKQNHKSWRVEKAFQKDRGLVKIRVSVFKQFQREPLVVLKTIRLE